MLKIQMDLRAEREVLKNAGLEPVPGGELMMAAKVRTAVVGVLATLIIIG